MIRGFSAKLQPSGSFIGKPFSFSCQIPFEKIPTKQTGFK